MGCNSCKGKNRILENGNMSDRDLNFLEKAGIMFGKIIGFLIGGVILSIIAVPFSLWTLFKIVFLDESIDVVGIMSGIGNLLTPKNDNNDGYVDIDKIEDLDEYELMGVDDIKNKK